MTMDTRNGMQLGMNQPVVFKRNLLEPVEGKIWLPYADFEKLDVLERRRLSDKFVVQPTYMTPKAVGADCFASEEVTIQAGEIKIIPTGIKAQFNGDHTGLFPFVRSSIPRKKGLILANGVGVVEEDYHGNPDNDGDIGFMFWNTSGVPVKIERFERLGQIVLLPITRFENAGKAGMERGQSGSTDK